MSTSDPPRTPSGTMQAVVPASIPVQSSEIALVLARLDDLKGAIDRLSSADESHTKAFGTMSAQMLNLTQKVGTLETRVTRNEDGLSRALRENDTTRNEFGDLTKAVQQHVESASKTALTIVAQNARQSDTLAKQNEVLDAQSDALHWLKRYQTIILGIALVVGQFAHAFWNGWKGGH